MSALTEASVRPSGDHARPLTRSVCHFNLSRRLNDPASHSRMFVSGPPEASVRPSRDHARLMTEPECSLALRASDPDSTSHSWTCWSLLPDASVRPSGDHARQKMTSEYFTLRSRPPVSNSHSS